MQGGKGGAEAGMGAARRTRGEDAAKGVCVGERRAREIAGGPPVAGPGRASVAPALLGRARPRGAGRRGRFGRKPSPERRTRRRTPQSIASMFSPASTLPAQGLPLHPQPLGSRPSLAPLPFGPDVLPATVRTPLLLFASSLSLSSAFASFFPIFPVRLTRTIAFLSSPSPSPQPLPPDQDSFTRPGHLPSPATPSSPLPSLLCVAFSRFPPH